MLGTNLSLRMKAIIRAVQVTVLLGLLCAPGYAGWFFPDSEPKPDGEIRLKMKRSSNLSELLALISTLVPDAEYETIPPRTLVVRGSAHSLGEAKEIWRELDILSGTVQFEVGIYAFEPEFLGEVVWREPAWANTHWQGRKLSTKVGMTGRSHGRPMANGLRRGHLKKITSKVVSKSGTKVTIDLSEDFVFDQDRGTTAESGRRTRITLFPQKSGNWPRVWADIAARPPHRGKRQRLARIKIGDGEYIFLRAWLGQEKSPGSTERIVAIRACFFDF